MTRSRKASRNVLHVKRSTSRGLKAADKSLMVPSSSDPFCHLTFGDKKEKTDVDQKISRTDLDEGWSVAVT